MEIGGCYYEKNYFVNVSNCYGTNYWSGLHKT